MQLKYVDTKEEIIAINRKSKHIEPHLHNALEIVCVTSGALELGVGQELYHMEKGDIGFVFPDVIHHYQVLTPGVNKATYLIASPFTIAKFADIMQSMAPEYPIIKAEKVEPEVYRVINAILETEQSDITVAQAYLQIVLARCIGKLNLVEKSSVGSNDLIYQTVSYISANFKKKFSLEEMAKDLGVSKYVLSRLFSKTFHRNFNQYLNDARLNYACHRLENTSDSITNICLDSGFESQRTFNRVFKERYKISPSDYREYLCERDVVIKGSVERWYRRRLLWWGGEAPLFLGTLRKRRNLVWKGGKLLGETRGFPGRRERGPAPPGGAWWAPLKGERGTGAFCGKRSLW